MAIYLASINDQQHHHGQVYCTTVKPMQGYTYLSFLAPTWDLVGGYKNHEAQGRDARWMRYTPLDEEQYTRAYWSLMMSPERKPQWNAWVRGIQLEEDSTLLCYCPGRKGTFCHRQIIADMLHEWRDELIIFLY